MAQSRATGKGQRKGKNVPIGDAPPLPISSGSASVPSIGSRAATTTSNVEGRQQPQDNKYPLWKYVTREKGSGNKIKEGGNVAWKYNYCSNHFMSTYYCVKAHLFALPSCGIGACTQVSLAKRKEMEKEANIGMAKVAATSKKNKNDDPLPFLRKSNNKFPFESSGGRRATKRKAMALGPVDKIFQKVKREELDLTIAFLFLSELHILYCCTLTFIYLDVSSSNSRGSIRVCAS